MGYEKELAEFKDRYEITGKGGLALVVQLTRAFSSETLPIDQSDYVTSGKGQVAGISGSNLKRILASHGIQRILAKEGGRTSRRNMERMAAYVELINGLPRPVDFEAIEDYWVDCVRDFFNNEPFTLGSDSSRSVSTAIEGLLLQAEERQRSNPGTTYVGTILQHLTAAKLSMLGVSIEVHGVSDADDQTGRAGDFVIGDSVIHCTTAPASPLIDKCASNLEHGLHPVILTIAERTNTAHNLLDDRGIGDRVEVWSFQQFLSTNIYEHGSFSASKWRQSLAKLIRAYNRIIEEHETDPSLRIEYDAESAEDI